MTNTIEAEKITELVNKFEITDVVNSYFQALDTKKFDVKHLATIFTADAKVMRPNNTALVGPKIISSSYQKSFARFEGTQHLLTGHDIHLEGDVAEIRVNLVAMHLWTGSNSDANQPNNFFVAGAVITGQLLHADDQWKISFLDNTNVWRAGSGFKNMEQTDK